MAALLLPEDMVAEVLRRLPSRDLAAARCVRKSWRAAVDGRRLMEQAELRLQVAGIFLNYHNHTFSEFLARPSTAAFCSGKLHGYLGADCSTVKDHCNGLLLLDEFVVNPATRRYASLPPRPPRRHVDLREFDYLAFDPAMSPHYEVIIVPHAPFKRGRLSDHALLGWEWPPSPMTLQVCSSRTNAWEERPFVRQGEALGTIAQVQQPWPGDHEYAVYWRGQLYVHHQFIMRISLSSGKYRVIQPPPSTVHSTPQRLGKSEKGVYLASIASPGQQLQVWILDESSDWVLKHQADLTHMLSRRIHNNRQGRGPWIMEDVNYHFFRSQFPNEQAPPVNNHNLEWDSDNDDVVDTGDTAQERYNEYFSILGFHPHKEVVFIGETLKRALAYHLNTSKLQDLGDIYPTCYGYYGDPHLFIQYSFPYTPCWTGDQLPDGNK